MKVFYVDDERFNLLLFRKSMPSDWVIRLFAKPSELLEVIDSNPPDVVISDEHMEEMYGSEMLEKIHLKHPDIFKVIITGKVDIEHLKDQVQSGEINYFLGKPYDPSHLIQIIEERFPRSEEKIFSDTGLDTSEVERARVAVFQKAQVAYDEFRRTKQRLEHVEGSLQDALSDLAMHIRINVEPAILKAIAESVFDRGGSYADFQVLIWKFAKSEKGS